MSNKIVKHRRTKLVEAKYVEFEDNKEKALKKRLINLLKDDGRGHHHAKYAERLERFDIQIVPLRIDENFTAAISFETGIIYIGEGFLNNPSTFYQLNVLIRHELAHNLLMHQIRMAYKIGEEAHLRLGLSESIFNLYNIIADDEISNRKYSEEDKIVVRNMELNGRVIGGLVTEDHRESWKNLSIEEMYDRICDEIEEINNKLLSGKSKETVAAEKPNDFIRKEILKAYIYSDTHSDSIIPIPIEKFIEDGCSIGGKTWKGEYKKIAELIYDELKSGSYGDADLQDLFDKITKSSPIKAVDLFNNKKVMLYIPEEKLIAIEVLKKFKSAYAEWYDKVLGALDELSDSELRELLDILK